MPHLQPRRSRPRAEKRISPASIAGATTLATAMLFQPHLEASDRPTLTHVRISSPFGANGSTSSIDGRIFIGNVYEDAASMTTMWSVRVFRPEAVDYDGEGRPVLSSAFSSGKLLELHNGENAVAMCFTDPTSPYRMESGQAVYEPMVFDSQMFGSGADAYKFRRRAFSVRVSNPFSVSAEVSQASAGGLELLTTTSGAPLMGIEPTLTADGRLFLFQGSPANDGSIDHLMYSYNRTPCAASGWSTPQPLSSMATDPDTDLKRYPLAWQSLKAATGESFSSSYPLHAAYPWVDHEGRNVVYMSVPYTDGARREAVSVIGADTGWTAHHIDGGINAGRYQFPKLFYSGPMWSFEQERPPEQNLPVGSSNEDHYLPVTKNHDLLPLFGSNTGDYNEVDLADLLNPFHLLYLPMNELVTRSGTYDLTRSPDLSGRFQNGQLQGSAQISASNDITGSSSGSLWEPHGKGKALVLSGGGGLKANLSMSAPGVRTALRGFTVQLAIRPDSAINNGCSSDTWRYLAHKQGAFDLTYEADNTVRFKLKVGRKWLDLGKSPAIPKGSWTHLAYTWDGVTGEMREYINGVWTGRSLPTAAGSFRLNPGAVTVGTGDTISGSSCGAGTSFQGAIDELRLLSHTRSNRSVCLNTLGVDCLEDAIQEDPSSGQFVLSHQQPTCNGPEDLGSLACASAMHRVCAQRGAMDALASTSNLWDTVSQLISSRPPIALAGAPAGSSSTQATVACTPIEHQSMAVTYEELIRQHGECKSEKDAMTTGCAAATHRWCSNLGWNTGTIFESTTRAWVGCFDADLIENVPQSALPGCQSGDWGSADCRVSVSAWCQSRLYNAGMVQEVPAASTAEVHCYQAASVTQWPFNP